MQTHCMHKATQAAIGGLQETQHTSVSNGVSIQEKPRNAVSNGVITQTTQHTTVYAMVSSSRPPMLMAAGRLQ